MVPDITVYDRNGEMVLLVEVKVKTGTDVAWAAEIYHKFFDGRRMSQPSRYFLLALPDRFYLWEKPTLRGSQKPDREIDPLPFLNPYYRRIGRSLDSFGHGSFEMIVSSWLTEILMADTLDLLTEQGPWLFESGLGEALIGGKLAREVPV